ncbi:heme ABC transporter ATP-binding protein [Enterovirga rhinocerotis]|uniref:Iron complex transport system ATP-binding protein n=1 Tax=Enterovirga rhinocerotis TaxID=1339210 RepID=A0A4R7BU32_9HYPH|nr:heme ABC transporter ATP-binding protein [Enterovirga rhinocerotis]TDR89264.1 iron complex transport system ATP-binding protein [Enterovirga rhinocerotis]
MTAPLEGHGLTFRVGAKTLLEDVSLSVGSGRLTVIIGPNGAGKSTLVKLLSGETAPASGRVLYGGEDVRSIEPWRLACLRVVLPQASRLAFPFTAGEVVRIGIDGIGRGLGRRDRDAILEEALRRADVAHLATRAYQSLSGGEQQRTQFARVLAQLAAGRSVSREQVLLLDEPIASLDLKHQIALLDAAAEFAADGVAVLAVLHDLNLAAAYADDVLVMSRGRAAAFGPPREIITDSMVSEVFDVALKVGASPGPGQPFLIPPRRRTASASPAP